MSSTLRAKPVRQRRSEEKRDRILRALEVLLTERDFSQIRVADIAERAQLSPATIYQRFSNRDAALSILIELYVQRSLDWALSEEGRVDFRQDPDLRSALVRLASSAWRQADALGYVMRPAYLCSRSRPDLLGEVWQQTAQLAREGFAALLKHFDSEVTSSSLATADLIKDLFNFMLLGKLLHADTDAEHFRTEHAFSEALANLALGYLTGPVAESRAKTTRMRERQ